MKKNPFGLSVFSLMLVGMLFFSCSGDEGDTFFATTTIDSPSVTANAYPGVNVLTWKAVKDADSYTVYRTVGNGDVEEKGVTSADVCYIDTDIDSDTAYKYRIVANPSDRTVHDASQLTVSLTTAKTWAPEGTVFSSLARYEPNYNEIDTVLSASTITAKLITSSVSSVRITFPTKAYASYTVYLSQQNGVLTNESTACETSKTIYGYNYNGSATITLDALFSGTKQVTVVATPLNDTLYRKSSIASTKTVEVKALNSISSATASGVSAEWTNYTSWSYTANARVYFSPYVSGTSEFATSEYTIYRAVYTSDGEESTTLMNRDGYLRIYDSITNLGSPKKDTSVSANGDTVYYLDDTVTLNPSDDIAGVRYYVVLNHNGYIKTDSSRIIVPDSADASWNFTPSSGAGSSSENTVAIADIYINDRGYAYVGVKSDYYYPPTGTYGTFDTLNAAKVAVNSELPSKLDQSYSAYGNYSYIFTTDVAVDTSKYYAFRILSTRYNDNDAVATTIAKPYKVGEAYYWDVIANYPSNYASNHLGTLSLTLDTDLGTDYYNYVTLNYALENTVENETVYYTIYRYSSWADYNADEIDWDFATLVTTTTDTQYTDYGISSKYVDSEHIYYKVAAVGYYNASESAVIKASRLKTPTVTMLDSSSISWNTIYAASGYRIYQAQTAAELTAKTADAYIATISNMSTTTYNITQNTGSNYWYAVRAYEYDENTGTYNYSKLSSSFLLTGQ